MANYKHYYTCESCRANLVWSMVKIVGTRVMCEKCQTSMLNSNQ